MGCTSNARAAGLLLVAIMLIRPERLPAAQTSGTAEGFTFFPRISCGEVVEGVLTADDPTLDDGVRVDDYDFTVPGSTTISVLVETTEFDPWVYVSDFDLIEIIDQGFVPLALPLPANDYVLSVSNFDPLPTGTRPYQVGLSCGDYEAEEIVCGLTIAGQLDPRDTLLPDGSWIDDLAFELPAPMRVRFDLSGSDSSGSFDLPGYVLVTDEDSEIIGEGEAPFEISLPPGRYFVYPNSLTALLDDTYPYLFSARCTAEGCPGDCDGSGSVSINELVRGVRIVLGSTGLDQCPFFDTSGDGRVSVSELVQAVNATLRGCA